MLSFPRRFFGPLLIAALGCAADGALAASAANGQTLYNSARCFSCHGTTPAVNTAKVWNGVSAQTTKSAFLAGGAMSGYMPALTGGLTLTDSDFNDLALYIATARGNAALATCMGGSCTTVLAPVATLSSSAAQSFPSVTTGTTSTAHTVTLTNSGTAALTITSISVTNPVFAVGHTCGTSVAVGASCTINTTYAPTVVGTSSANLSIVTNAGTSTIVLSGTGVAPVVTAPMVSLSSAAQTFGVITTGTTSPAQTITLTNTGNAALSISAITLSNPVFTASHTCGTSLAVAASCVITTHFVPTVAGAASATLSLVTNAASSPNTVALSGTGAAPVVTAPVVSLSSATQSFGVVTTGLTSAAQTVTLTNAGNAALSISAITLSNPVFTASHTCGTSLAVAASCVITTHFVPTVAGAASGTLSLFSNAGSSPNTVALSGTGTAQAVLAPAITLSPATGLNFNATVGTPTAAQTVTLTNTGNAVLTLTGITSSNAAFTVTNTCGTSVAVGASCTITVIFTPVASGQVQAGISIASNVSPSPPAIAMVGTGVAVGVPTALLHWNNAAPFSFGTSVAVGTRMAYSFTLSNAGAAPATGVLLALSGPDLADFNLSGSCLGVNGVTLLAGTGCQITVTFAPATAGAKSVSLGLTAQGGAAPAAITLSATALASTSSAGSVGNLSTANSAGGCTLGHTDQPADPLWLLMLGAAALVLRRRRSSFLA
jgi:MYXO-CTERM domain-containing protein